MAELALSLCALVFILPATTLLAANSNRWDHRFKIPGQLPSPLIADHFAAHKTALWKREIYLAGSVVFGGKSIAHLARKQAGEWTECAPDFPGHVLRLMPLKDRLAILGSSTRYADWSDPIPTNLFVVTWDGRSWTAPEFGPDGSLSNVCVTAHATSANGRLALGINPGGWNGPVASVLIREPDGRWWRTADFGRGKTTRIEQLAVNDAGGLAAIAYVEHERGHGEMLLQLKNGRWQELPGAPEGGLHAVAIADGGDLFLGGELRGQPFASHRGVWRLSGSGWHPFGESFHSREVERDTPSWSYALQLLVRGDKLLVAGKFMKAGEQTVNGLCLLGPDSVQAFDGGVSGGGIMYVTGKDYCLAIDSTTVQEVHEEDGQVLAFGRFSHAGTVSAPKLALWDGREWSSPFAEPPEALQGFDRPVNAFAVFEQQLIVAGLEPPGSTSGRVKAWNGEHWIDRPGIHGQPELLAASSNRLVVLAAAPMRDFVLSEFQAGRWIDLPPPIPTGVVNDSVPIPRPRFPTSTTAKFHQPRALAIVGTNLLLGGQNLLVWNGHDWRLPWGKDQPPLSAHLLLSSDSGRLPTCMGGDNSMVLSLAPMADGRLLVGGTFDRLGSVMTRGAAIWDGLAWLPLEGTLTAELMTARSITSLVEGGTNIYAAGQFMVGDRKPRIGVAIWNDPGWKFLGAAGKDFSPHSTGYLRAADEGSLTLAHYGDHLYVAGSFSTFGSVAAAGIASWNGSQWSPLGDGLRFDRLTRSDPIRVNALLIHDGYLWVGGAFSHAGGFPSGHISRWRLN